MNKYTVIGIYPDCTNFSNHRLATFVDPVEAETPTVAARVAKRRMAKAAGFEADDIAIIAVFEGDHHDCYEPSLDTAEYEKEARKA